MCVFHSFKTIHLKIIYLIAIIISKFEKFFLKNYMDIKNVTFQFLFNSKIAPNLILAYTKTEEQCLIPQQKLTSQLNR